jgi:hypothetical protein
MKRRASSSTAATAAHRDAGPTAVTDADTCSTALDPSTACVASAVASTVSTHLTSSQGAGFSSTTSLVRRGGAAVPSTLVTTADGAVVTDGCASGAAHTAWVFFGSRTGHDAGALFVITERGRRGRTVVDGRMSEVNSKKRS